MCSSINSFYILWVYTDPIVCCLSPSTDTFSQEAVPECVVLWSESFSTWYAYVWLTCVRMASTWFKCPIKTESAYSVELVFPYMVYLLKDNSFPCLEEYALNGFRDMWLKKETITYAFRYKLCLPFLTFLLQGYLCYTCDTYVVILGVLHV